MLMSFRDDAIRRWVGLQPFPEPSLIHLRYPVVLMHGFGLAAAARRGGHLHAEAMHLRAHGIWAYAPNVASYTTVSARSALWKQRFEHILNETKAEKLNLIAHSMGGLDARHLISVLNLHPRVATLTTISTPHYGTPLANLMLEQPEGLLQSLAAFADYVSSTALEDASGNLMQALEELTPEHVCTSFNPAVPNHPDVVYWSYAGAAGKDTDTPINPFLRYFNTVVYQRAGLNDGFVPVDSARWGTFQGTIPADHAQQVGLQGIQSSDFDTHAFYCELSHRLADAGF